MSGSRYTFIPKSRWPYLGAALRGLDADLEAVESSGSGFVLLGDGEPVPDPPVEGVVYLRPVTPPPATDRPTNVAEVVALKHALHLASYDQLLGFETLTDLEKRKH